MTLEFMKHIYRNPIDGFCNTCKRRNQTAVNKNVNPTENYSTIKKKTVAYHQDGKNKGNEDRIANQRCSKVPYVQRNANITDKPHMALAK
jgi:hypothetical protein